MRRLLDAGPLALLACLALATGAQARPMEFGVYPGRDFTFGRYVGIGAQPVSGPDLALPRILELAGDRRFQVHNYAEWKDGVRPATDAQIRDLVARGLTVNTALKYLPPDGHDGDVAGFANWVREVVHSHPQVGVWQITNEANVGLTKDSDGGATDAVGALIEGVKAAASAKRPGQKVGFNWFYRLDPLNDSNFWSTLGSRGGGAFRHAVDFAGVDIYSGTYIPPLYSLNDAADYRTALDYLRNRMMPLAGLGASVPIYIQETGYPTVEPFRSEEHQAEALRQYIAAAQDYGVDLLQWFQLTDAKSPLGDGWGILRPDFSPKPAFDVLKQAIRRLSPRRPRGACQRQTSA